MNKLFWIEAQQLAGRCGPGPAPLDLSALREAGFRYILSLDQEEHARLEEGGKGLERILIHLPNSIPPLPAEEKIYELLLPEAVDHVVTWTSRNNGAVLVHCHAGNDRTGGVLTGYLSRARGIPPGEALKEVRSANPDAISARGYEAMILSVLERVWEARNRGSMQ